MSNPYREMAFTKSESHAVSPNPRPKPGKKKILGCWRSALPTANTPNLDFVKTLPTVMGIHQVWSKAKQIVIR